MTTPTDDRPELLTVIANMHAKPGREQELREALEALTEPTKAEAGYVNYDLHHGVADPGLFSFYENWESPEHLEAHFQTPHLVEFVAKMDDLLDENGLNVQQLRRIA